MKVTLVPTHIVVLPVVIAVDTEGVSRALTAMLMPVLVAVVGVAHEALLIITQLMTSAFAKVVLV